MYIQPQQNDAPPSIPEGYRGSAFSVTPEAPPPPTKEPKEEPSEEPHDEPPAAEAFAPFGEHKEDRHRDHAPPHARFPFLSALLPPKRREGKGGLPDWVLLAAVAVLFFSEENDNDILPFLLLLLLWD